VYGIVGVIGLSIVGSWIGNEGGTGGRSSRVSRDDLAVGEAAGADYTERLRQVIESTHESCYAARRTYFQGATNAADQLWNVECSTGKSYVVLVNTNGSTRVLDCQVQQRVTGNRCFAPIVP
jgi:hypothetical protein